MLPLLLSPLAKRGPARLRPSTALVETNGTRCAAGRFGDGCNFSRATIFHEHEVYGNTTDLPRRAGLDGWSPPCDFYEGLVRQHTVNFVVEVGVWKGKSAICLARALQAGGGGALIAIDTWLGALEFWTRSASRGRYDPKRALHFNHGYPQVYFHFLANIVRANVAEYVIPFPSPSRLAHDFLAQLGSARPDMVHIDAAHEYDDAVEDIRMWWGLLRAGGVLLGDDFVPTLWPGVVQAACEHAQRWALQMFRTQNYGALVKWWVIKPHGDAAPRAPHSASWLASCMHGPDRWVGVASANVVWI